MRGSGWWRGAIALSVALVAVRVGGAEPPIVPWNQAADHVGDRIAAEGDVVEAVVENGALVLRFVPDRDAFHVLLVLPMFSDLPRRPERLYLGKRIRASGTVRRFAGRPEMVVGTPEEIEVVGIASAAAASDVGSEPPEPRAALPAPAPPAPSSAPAPVPSAPPSATPPPPAPVAAAPTPPPPAPTAVAEDTIAARSGPIERPVPAAPVAAPAPPTAAAAPTAAPASPTAPAAAAAAPPAPAAALPPNAATATQGHAAAAPPTLAPSADAHRTAPAEPAEDADTAPEPVWRAIDPCARARDRWRDAADDTRARLATLDACLARGAAGCRAAAAAVAPALSTLEWAEQDVEDACP